MQTPENTNPVVLSAEKETENTEIKPEKPIKPKKKATPAQLAGFAKGMAVLKAKREANAKLKEERLNEGLPPPPKEERKKKVQNYREVVPPKVRKERTVYTTPLVKKESIFSDSEYLQLKELLMKEKNPTTEVIKEVIKEMPIERIVHKDRVLTGSELLNRIFF